MSQSLLTGRRAVVYGLGRSGLAAITLLQRQGALVSAVDDRGAAAVGEPVSVLKAAGVRLSLGGADPGLLAEADVVVVSPGVPLLRPELVRAREAGARIWGEVELAFRCLPEGRPLLGITGTNGKSTTTALCGELLAKAGLRPFVGGNLGRPLSEAALSPEEFGAYVVELSSFQLEGIERLRCTAAALLNVSPDHLDRYPSLRAYADAKTRIFENQLEGDVRILNLSDPVAVEVAGRGEGTLSGFIRDPQARERPPGGLARPRPGGFEVVMPDGVRCAFRVGSPALRGAHNLENAMAATLLALASGARAAIIQEGLDGFLGLPHRLERVAVLGGVEFVNDSKATNVESAVAGLSAFHGGVWLIAGGRGKGASYRPLVEAGRGRIRGVLTVGEDAERIGEAFLGTAPVHPCGTLEVAVARARELAVGGEVVLLAPACASLDQFRNFEHRGETFRSLLGAPS